MYDARNGLEEAIILVISLVTVRLMTQTLRCKAMTGFKSLAELEDADQLLEEITVTTHRLQKELQQLIDS